MSDLPKLPQGYLAIPKDYDGVVYLESQIRAYGALCRASVNNEPTGKKIDEVFTKEWTTPLPDDTPNVSCQKRLKELGLMYPRTCAKCGLFGPCREVFLASKDDQIIY